MCLLSINDTCFIHCLMYCGILECFPGQLCVSITGCCANTLQFIFDYKKYKGIQAEIYTMNVWTTVIEMFDLLNVTTRAEKT